MRANTSIFDSLYPDEEGLIEARKRLLQKAFEAYYDGLSFEAWVERIWLDDPWTEYYVELLGKPILEHIGAMVWKPIIRE